MKIPIIVAATQEQHFYYNAGSFFRLNVPWQQIGGQRQLFIQMILIASINHINDSNLLATKRHVSVILVGFVEQL